VYRVTDNPLVVERFRACREHRAFDAFAQEFYRLEADRGSGLRGPTFCRPVRCTPGRRFLSALHAAAIAHPVGHADACEHACATSRHIGKVVIERRAF
jgi:hypothetical protein